MAGRHNSSRSRRGSRRGRAFFACAFAAAIVAAGCGGDDDDSSASATSDAAGTSAEPDAATTSTTEPTDDTTDDTKVDDTPPWRMTAQVIEFEDGLATFECPPDGDPYPVWGTGTYTNDSSICTAAVHHGLIAFSDGGDVSLREQPGQSSYEGSEANGVTSWQEMGCWTPTAKNGRASNQRALAAGAKFRPIAETIRDTAVWVQKERGDRPWRAGMKPEREAELLAKWRQGR